MGEQRVTPRYAPTRTLPRRLSLVLAGLAIAAAVLATAWLARSWTDPPVRSHLVGFGDYTDTSISATVEIDRRPGLPVRCVLVPIAADRGPAGEPFEVAVPAGPEELLRVRTTVPSLRPAVTVELRGCTAPGQTSPR